MTHRWREQLERDAGEVHPVSEGPPEVVRAARQHLRPLACGVEVAPEVGEAGKEEPLPAVLSGQVEQVALGLGDHRNVPETLLGLGAAEVHLVGAEVLAPGGGGLPPAGASGHDEGCAGRLALGELGQEFGELLFGEPSLHRGVVGREGDGHHLVDATAPPARADRQLQCASKGDQVLVDGVLGATFAAAPAHEAVDLGRGEALERVGDARGLGIAVVQ